MTLYILANPNAGSHTAEHIIFKIKESYPQLAVNIFMTVGPEDEKIQIEAILKEFVSSEDKLMILGGDGTLSKALRFYQLVYRLLIIQQDLEMILQKQ